jgi:serine/threonine protein kinase
MIDKCSKKHKFFNVKDYRIIRSPQSRLKGFTKNQGTLYQALFSNRFPDTMKNAEIHDQLSEDERHMVDFIKRCLQIDPTKRLTCDEAIRHEWFKPLLIQTEKEIE